MNDLSVESKAAHLRQHGYWIGKHPRTDVVACVYDLDAQKRTDPVTWNKYGRADRPMAQQSDRIFESRYQRDYSMYEVIINTKGCSDQNALSISIKYARMLDNELLRRQALEHLAVQIVNSSSEKNRYRAIILFKEALNAAKACGPQFSIDFALQTIENAKSCGLNEKEVAELTKYADFDQLTAKMKRYYETHPSSGGD